MSGTAAVSLGHGVVLEPQGWAPRLGRALFEARRERRASLRELARQSGGRFSARDLRQFEKGARPAGDLLTKMLADLYEIDLVDVAPPRGGLELDLEAGLIAAGGATRRFAPTDDVVNAALVAYLELVWAMRGTGRSVVPLREHDVNVLAGVLDLDEEVVVASLAELMQCSTRDARRLLAVLHRRSFMAPATAAVLAGLVIGISAQANRSAAPAPFGLDRAPALGAGTDTTGIPAPTPALLGSDTAPAASSAVTPDASNAAADSARASSASGDGSTGGSSASGSSAGGSETGGSTPSAPDSSGGGPVGDASASDEPSSSDEPGSSSEGGTTGGDSESGASQNEASEAVPDDGEQLAADDGAGTGSDYAEASGDEDGTTDDGDGDTGGGSGESPVDDSGGDPGDEGQDAGDPDGSDGGDSGDVGDSSGGSGGDAGDDDPDAGDEGGSDGGSGGDSGGGNGGHGGGNGGQGGGNGGQGGGNGGQGKSEYAPGHGGEGWGQGVSGGGGPKK